MAYTPKELRSSTVSGQRGLKQGIELHAKDAAPGYLWTVQALCVLRARLEMRPNECGFSDREPPFKDRTAEIAELTRVWRESWILPLIDALIKGDKAEAAQFI